MGVITPLSEQLTKPFPNAMALVNLKELSTGAYKLLPEGTISIAIFCVLTPDLGMFQLCSLMFLLINIIQLFIRHTLGCVCSW